MTDKSSSSLVIPMGDPEIKPFIRKMECVEYSYYLNTEIGEASDYADMCNTIRNAGPQDVVIIYLNTPGGSLDTGLAIINAIRASEANVITVMDGSVQSMGAFIFLAGHEWVVHDNCMLMLHNYRGGLFGKGHEQVAELKAVTVWVDRLVHSLCKDFMTEQEMSDLLQGKDFWMESTEVKSRINKLIAKSKEKATKATNRKTVPKPKRTKVSEVPPNPAD